MQHAPAVSVTLGEEFGVPAGADVIGAMTAALRRLGFDRVFDTGFTADLTIMEEGSELVHRLHERRQAADADQLLAGLDQVRRDATIPTSSTISRPARARSR